jgi:hypothetical protein
MAKKKKGQKTVLEAVDTLSHLADLDVEKPEQVEWLDPAKIEQNQEAIRETFQTVNSYLQHMYQKDRGELARAQTQKGLRAMIQLAGEAVDKVDQYTELFRGAHTKDETISEFKKLQHFYLTKVFSKIKQDTGEELWELESEFAGTDEGRHVLKDLETVRQDRDYELFYMTHDDGTVFFSSNLLKHLRLVGNFDETFISVEREDTLSKLDVMLDRDLHVSAQKVLQECSDLIDLFYKEVLQHKDNETLMCITKAIMALLLAANPKNLMTNTKNKCVTDYWNDFISYLRLGLQTENYEKWRGVKKQPELYQICLKLMHRMCHALFLRSGASRDDLALLYHFVGKDLKQGIWVSLAEADDKMLQELQNYPSGPLMKILKMFRKQEEKEGFDPVMQNNAPGQIFTLTTEDLHTTIIHMPAPVHMATVDTGEITAEFRGYLHSLGERKHLYVDLQDRNSWKERFRSKLLEDMSQKGEFSQNLHFVALSKDSHFYYQIEQYAKVENAKQFCQLCVEQILGGSENGFYFPSGKTPKEWLTPLVKFIHTHFFANTETVDRKQKLDFIEILYFFITLRYLDQEKPDVLNFSCKDGIDTGAAAAAAFYGFTRMLSSETPWTENDRNCFLFTLFVPALSIRHRSIDSSRLQRMLSALEHFEGVLKEKRDEVLKGCAKILPEIPLKKLKISEVA